MLSLYSLFKLDILGSSGLIDLLRNLHTVNKSFRHPVYMCVSVGISIASDVPYIVRLYITHDYIDAYHCSFYWCVIAFRRMGVYTSIIFSTEDLMPPNENFYKSLIVFRSNYIRAVIVMGFWLDRLNKS